jgi:hypothetical protein
LYIEKAIPLSMQRLKITAVRLDFLQCITDINVLQVATEAFTEGKLSTYFTASSHIYLCIFRIKEYFFVSVFKVTTGKCNTMPKLMKILLTFEFRRAFTRVNKCKGDYN